jgi:glycosyltransferase involved in cell wall biosynthesis
MRILMLAPEPFFQPRGTPFSEYYRIKALIELGHEVDLVTYPVGDDVQLPGLHIFRTARLPGIHSVPIGPSLVKIPLDVLLFFSSLRRMLAMRYDLLDCHEEAGLMGVVLSRLFGVPTIYDMHSSLPEQLTNFRFTGARLWSRALAVAERLMIRGSDAVITICPHLRDQVTGIDPTRPCFLIENSPLAESAELAQPGAAETLRRRWGLEDSLVVLYTGTFEAYQGLDLLLQTMRRVLEREPRARLLLVGGNSRQVAGAKAGAEALGVDGTVILTGQRPPGEMSSFLAAADILVSPRSSGNNTPLKIYSYLRAGKPIVATRLLTHTQVLDDEVALLTAPDPEAFAAAILTLAGDPVLRARLGANARQRAEESYSYERYLERTKRVCDFIAPGGPEAVPSGATSL